MLGIPTNRHGIIKPSKTFPDCDATLVPCTHQVPEFGCQSCINKITHDAMRATYEAPDFQPPVCRDCNKRMVLSDYDLPGKFMTFECTSTDGQFGYCGNEERVKL